MNAEKLTAVVIGAGWAGEGNTIALQQNGVEVVAICARKAEIVQNIAAKLGVAQASTDWRQTLLEVRPDIVALTTPAALRGEVVEVAAQLGSHVLCEKPLATTVEEAHKLYTIAKQAGVKHAFAVTHRYDAGVAWIADLLASEAIGQVRAIDIIQVVPFLQETTPWGWMDSLALGGGLMNNGLPHLLAMLERMLQARLQAVAGEALVLRQKAPFVPDIHDFREWQGQQVPAAEAAKLEWRPCDADSAVSILLNFDTALHGHDQTIPVFLHGSLMAPAPGPANGWYFYGDKGTIIAEGLFSLTIKKISTQNGLRQIPQRFLAELPEGSSDLQRKWNAVARDFVADIRGEARNLYPTFLEGWRYQAAIDAIRQSKGWSVLGKG